MGLSNNALSRSRVRRRGVRAICDALETRQLFAFGLTTSTSSYTVDTGAGVTFSVLRGGTLSSTIHLGDLTSFKLNGTEFSAPYASTSRYSHFESGLSSLTVMSATTDPAGNWIRIACDDTTATTGSTAVTGVIQYYIAKKNDPNIYMATYAPEMLVSSTRFITYLDWNKFPYRPDESDTSGGSGAIESSDVQGFADGTTASKYYGETRNIDHLYHAATGPSAGAFMFVGNRESGAGGPFWKDIDFQSTGAAVEIYTMPFSGHSLTDTFRPGLHGPFALSLTNGSTPSTLPDYSFLENVGLTGWVSASARGSLSGRATGVAAGKIATVGLSNTAAQYWATPDALGNYTINGIKPGTYTETLYEEELAVGTRSVTITAAQTTRADITATAIYGLSGSNNTFTAFNNSPSTIWRIGTWDGTPREFLNGDKITIMHPQDSRLSPWAADATGFTNFTIGTNVDSDWPLAEWKTQVGAVPYVDTKNRITFNVTPTQRAQAMTLRIGVARLDSERPGVSVNGGTTTYSATILTQPNTRGVSLGNWRGNNGIYSYSFAANTFQVGTNTIDIYAVSGSTFTGYFSGYHIYDAVDLIQGSSALAPSITSLTVSPGTNTNIGVNGSRLFTALGNSTSGQQPVNVVWSATRGTINDAGEYIAPTTSGTDTITATLGAVAASVTVNVLTTVPTIATPATPLAPVIYNNTTTLSVLGADDGGEGSLAYSWSVVGAQPGTVTFGASNGTNAGKNITATFGAYGIYTLQATITDAGGRTTVSQTTVVYQNERLLLKADQPNGAAITDYSGNDFTGTAYGTFDYPAGKVGNALHLAGGAATLPNGVVAGLDDFTVATWVKPDSLSDWARIFDFGGSTTSYMFLCARAGATGRPLRFAIKSSSSVEQIVDGPALATGVWTHVAITLSGNTATLYVNGIPVGSNTGVTVHPAALGNTTRNYLGESQFASDPTFLGAIDDFRVYGRALTPSEVAKFSDTTPPTVTGSIFNYETGPKITVTFSENVIDSLIASDFTLTNLTTGTTIPVTLTTQGTPATPTIATLTPTTPLTNGNYRLTINGVNDVAGNAMAAPSTYDFYFLNADANRDRIVDTQDFNLLASNFGGTGKLFSQGNFNYDAAGNVDSQDFNVLVQHYGIRLPAPASSVGALALAAATPLFSQIGSASINRSLWDLFS